MTITRKWQHRRTDAPVLTWELELATGEIVQYLGTSGTNAAAVYERAYPNRVTVSYRLLGTEKWR